MASNMIKPILFFVLPLLVFVPVAASAQNAGSIEVFIKSESGDRVAPSGLSLKVFKDLGTAPLQEMTPVNENPATIRSLPVNHRYKIEVYMNSMYAGVGFIDLKTSHENLEIPIKNTGGMRLNVFYKDGQTPLKNVGVSIKSHDGQLWSHSETDANGNTIRVWLHPAVRTGDYYYAEVIIGKDLQYTSAPIRLQPNVAQEFRIVTSWPTVVDKLITIDVYNSTQNKVSRQDGKFVAELYDRKNNKIAESSVIDSGVAYFSKLPVSNYYLYVKSQDAAGSLQTVATRLITITEASDRIPVYLNNPELNSDHLNCNCVAFRLDDVQDYFLAPAQIAVIKAFEKKQVPLTVGVMGSSIGGDPALVSAMRSALAGGNNLEIASHSWNNRVLTQMSKADQEKLIKDTNEKIESVFGITPTTFIPPENLFNDDTVSVLRTNGFTHLSSSVTVRDPPKFIKTDFYQFPSLPTTSVLDTATGMWVPVPSDEILTKIRESIFDYGYAVVTMHPHEFSLYEHGYVNKVNSTQIGQLELLIEKIKSDNMKILPVGLIQNYDADPVTAPPIVEPTKDHNCNCIAFRLDNVQDFWLNDVQSSVLDTFGKSKAPLTVTVIGKFIGDDPKTVNAIKDGLEKAPKIRLASKGWEHVDHSLLDTEKQIASITQTNNRIHDVFGVKANIFSPPYDAFNNDTKDAMRQSGMIYLSASTLTDSPPYTDDQIVRVPSTIYFANAVDDDPFLNGTLSQKALSKIRLGVEQYGFAVVSLQAQDFAVRHDSFQNEADPGKIGLLETLISDIRANGMIIVTIDRIPSLLSEHSVVVPEQVKDNSGWHSNEEITDSELARGFEYLAEQGVLKDPSHGQSDGGQKIPYWLKNVAGWWSEGRISDTDFVKGIQYLIEHGIIRI